MRANPTFQEIIEASRPEAAALAWERGELAGQLRYEMIRSKNFRAARRFGDLKTRAFERAAEILPEIEVKIDSDYQVGLLSVRWPGRGRFHLPPDSLPHRRLTGRRRPSAGTPAAPAPKPSLPEEPPRRPPAAGTPEDRPPPGFDYFAFYPYGYLY